MLKKIWKDERVCWRIIFILLNAFFSILCILITQNILISSFFVVGIAIIDILVEISKFIDLEKVINKLFSIKIYWYYIGFIFLALLPTIIGREEIEIQKNLSGKLFVNAVPNILGALIVCSIIEHISKFNYKNIVCLLIKEIKNYINIVIRIGFLGCFLNSANYKVNEKWNLVNIANSIYLFVIIFSGAIVLGSFVMRIVDTEYFGFTFKKVYPNKTLFFGELFLISCGIGPLCFKLGKHEPILLMMNSISACIIVIFLAVFISRRTEDTSDIHKIKRIIAFGIHKFKWIILFILIAGINCAVNFYNWDKSGNWSQQIFSGVAILIFVLSLLLWLNKVSKRTVNKSLE